MAEEKKRRGRPPKAKPTAAEVDAELAAAGLEVHLSLAAVALVFDTSEKTILRWIRAGRIKARRLGVDVRSAWKVPKSEVQRLLNQADADAAATLAISETGGFSFPAKKTGRRRAKPTA